MSNSKLLERFKKDMEGRELTKQEGNFSLAAYCSVLPCLFAPYITPYYDFDYIAFLFNMKGKHGALFFDLERYQKNTRVAFERFLKSNGKENFPEYRDFTALWKKIDEDYQKYSPEIIGSLDDQKLDKIIKEFYTDMLNIIVTTVFSESIDKGIVRELYSSLGGEEEKFEEFFEKVSKMSFESFDFRLSRALSEFDEQSNPYNQQWLMANWYDSISAEETRDEIIKRIKEAGGQSKIKEEARETKKELEENREESEIFCETLSKDLKHTFEFIQLAGYLRDTRKVPLQKSITLIANTIREIFKRKGINPENYVLGYVDDFMNDLYKKDEYSAEIARRKEEGVVVYIGADGTQFEYGNTEDILKQAYVFMDKDSSDETSELKGSIGCSGSAKGQVNIVLSEKDFAKFKEGDILVTSMTRPEFVPLMKKAAAIITDEGGITCHAAIVSRELKIPCIIGTKNATRALQDGQLVEVDANAGVVRIVK